MGRYGIFLKILALLLLLSPFASAQEIDPQLKTRLKEELKEELRNDLKREILGEIQQKYILVPREETQGPKGPPQEPPSRPPFLSNGGSI